MEQQVLRWIEFEHTVRQQRMDEEIVLGLLPNHLRDRLINHVYTDTLLSIDFLRNAPVSEESLDFVLARMAPLLDVYSFCENVDVLREKNLPSGLYIVLEGTLRMEMSNGEVIAHLSEGQYFGEGTLAGEHSVVESFGLDDLQGVTATFLKCLFISKKDFKKVLSHCSSDVKSALNRSLKECHARRQSLQFFCRGDGAIANFTVWTRWSFLLSKLRRKSRGTLLDDVFTEVMQKRRMTMVELMDDGVSEAQGGWEAPLGIVPRAQTEVEKGRKSLMAATTGSVKFPAGNRSPDMVSRIPTREASIPRTHSGKAVDGTFAVLQAIQDLSNKFEEHRSEFKDFKEKVLATGLFERDKAGGGSSYEV
eukprot:CAMPEP_0184316272 /NCGR_PEP_ID=MMETSP1049-20130417/89132_1 /TAXON_ID=77928 /ORGANISM="Proteomonas sulcata, Strain CCMP704" /LENGTH=363 /DNA_ID=CAMNT_0026635169 /DNA_START=101 /DNA_END=1192 /DNA_ORIENTATION=-